jgi:hypothetical protein
MSSTHALIIPFAVFESLDVFRQAAAIVLEKRGLVVIEKKCESSPEATK